MQMRNRVFRQNCDTIGGNQLWNTMVNLIVNMIRTTGENNTMFTVCLQPGNGFFTFSIHSLTCLCQFLPSKLCSFFDLGSRDLRKCFNQLRSYGVHTGESHERIAEINMFTAQFFHIILDIFRIRGNDRTVIMVIGIRELISFIWDCRIENEMYTLLNQPFNVPMSQLSRIAFGLAWNGFNTQFINLSGRCRGEHHTITKFSEELEPERIILIHIQDSWNTDGAAESLFLRQRLIGEEQLVFKFK